MPLRAPAFRNVGKKSMTEWYYADSVIMPRGTKPATAKYGVTAPSNEWLVIFNLAPREIEASFTYYFEDEPTRAMKRKLPPASSLIVPIHEEEFAAVVPRGKLYGCKITAPSPIIVQSTRSECEEVQKPALPGNSTTSIIAHPGPLGRAETVWAYADGNVIEGSWDDKEWITILNPHPRAVARVTFTAYRTGDPVLRHDFEVAAERVRTVDLFELPRLRRDKEAVFGVVVESTFPVVVEQIRRAVPRRNTNPRGMWRMLALPMG